MMNDEERIAAFAAGDLSAEAEESLLLDCEVDCRLAVACVTAIVDQRRFVESLRELKIDSPVESAFSLAMIDQTVDTSIESTSIEPTSIERSNDDPADRSPSVGRSSAADRARRRIGTLRDVAVATAGLLIGYGADKAVERFSNRSTDSIRPTDSASVVEAGGSSSTDRPIAAVDRERAIARLSQLLTPPAPPLAAESVAELRKAGASVTEEPRIYDLRDKHGRRWLVPVTRSTVEYAKK
jgi:hypothetical protein